MIRAASLDIDINLKSFSEQLHRLGLAHRIIEESGQQVIWVNNESEVQLLQQALSQWQQLDQEQQASFAAQSAPTSSLPPRQDWLRRATNALLASPVTWLLMLLSGGVALVSGLGANLGPVRDLFYPLLPDSSLVSLLSGIDSVTELIRTFTPMFLHFGELHLIFNMLWLWYFGKQLESLHSKWLFLALVLVTAFVSNTAQYLAQGYNNFGGMSGVVYGLVGYAWVIHYFMPRSQLMINTSMFVFFVIALVLMEVVASSWIATAAHAAGLVAGLLAGFAVVIYNRFVLGREFVGRQRSGPY
ncbi:MAG: rhomboid family intramembrane serine protease [Pseudomonadales bacterium]|nr:rhomboid family intramembrane serine protease [Pseudomonadales bacterium]